MKDINEELAKLVAKTIMERVVESIVERVDESMQEKVEDSMAKRVEDYMAQSVPPTFSILGIKSKFVRINLHSGNNQTQGVREEIIIKLTNNSNIIQKKKSLMNKHAKLTLDCNRMTATVLVKVYSRWRVQSCDIDIDIV